MTEIRIGTLIYLARKANTFNVGNKTRACRIMLMPEGFAVEVRDFTTTNLYTARKTIPFQQIAALVANVRIDLTMEALEDELDVTMGRAALPPGTPLPETTVERRAR